jgi:hypothetical protein
LVDLWFILVVGKSDKSDTGLGLVQCIGSLFGRLRLLEHKLEWLIFLRRLPLLRVMHK